MRNERIERIVANLVTDVLKVQVRGALPSLKRAVEKVCGRNMMVNGVGVKGGISVEFSFKSFDEDGLVMGAVVEYDQGSDTYNFKPFVVDHGNKYWGEESTDFYAEDLLDVSKVGYIFERVMKRVAKWGRVAAFSDDIVETLGESVEGMKVSLKIDVVLHDNGSVGCDGVRWGKDTNVGSFLRHRAEGVLLAKKFGRKVAGEKTALRGVCEVF